jgi:MFS transporter, SHS family, lactate transporter
MAVAGSEISISWWKEPNKDQWLAWFAGAFGWMLDGFDFTVFLLIMVPIAKEFSVSVTGAIQDRRSWIRDFPA